MRRRSLAPACHPGRTRRAAPDRRLVRVRRPERVGPTPPRAPSSARAATPLTPIMVKLLHDDADGLSPDFGSYTDVDLDQAIADFVGTAPGTFGADFAVTERPLTTAEAATAQANGRSFAYVPFAAEPGRADDPGAQFQLPRTRPRSFPSQFCQHIPLTPGPARRHLRTVPVRTANWGDSTLFCTLNPNDAAGLREVRPLGQPRPDDGERRAHVAARQHDGPRRTRSKRR